MASFCGGGTILMKPDKKHTDMSEFAEYPLEIPKVILDGLAEYYWPQDFFSWSDDSIITVRGNHVVRYIQSFFTEMLAQDEEGNIVWKDGRNAPFSDCWGGKYLGDTRGAKEFTIEEFNGETCEKRKYKVTLEETMPFNERDYSKMADYTADSSWLEKRAEFMVAEKMKNFEIDGSTLVKYTGNNPVPLPTFVLTPPPSFNTLYIADVPETITTIGERAFEGRSELGAIIIPESVTSIADFAFDKCNELTTITFNGTKEQWETIKKGDEWNSNTGNYKIYCKDGSIAKADVL